MEPFAPNSFNVFEIYARYNDIVSSTDHATSRDMLNMLAKSLESRGQMSDANFDDLSKLMSCLDFSADFRQFNHFYDFVFFICRKDGQKNITISRAIAAWRLVLKGRFRLLSQWCTFVEEHQRHNISEDTWQQILAFSRCVNEDLEGYDPKGAWPVLIDDFVEYMYRTSTCNNCGTRHCSCGDVQTPGITNTFSGLNLLPGSKRKSVADNNRHLHRNSFCAMRPKRSKHDSVPKRFGCWNSDFGPARPAKLEGLVCLRAGLPGPARLPTLAVDGTLDTRAEINRHNSRGCVQTTSVCAAEDSLSKGFEGHLSIGCYE